MGRTTYGYTSPRGIAGGLFDTSVRVVDSRITEGAVQFGMGLVQGSTPGAHVTIPSSTCTAAVFEGLVLNGGTTQLDVHGELHVEEGASVSMLREGRAWGRLAKDAAPGYGRPAYLVVSGVQAGLFTTEDDTEEKILIPAEFIGDKGTGTIAPLRFFNALVAEKTIVTEEDPNNEG